jgi:hypothetical protein
MDEMPRHRVAWESRAVDGENLQPLARQHQREGRAGAAGADDHDVMHLSVLLKFAGPADTLLPERHP